MKSWYYKEHHEYIAFLYPHNSTYGLREVLKKTLTKPKRATLPFLFSIISLSLSCCSPSQEKDTQKNLTVEENIEQPEKHIENSTVLTTKQINTVGIELGLVEQKELTATIQANGVLKVPNNNKANATTLYSGIVQHIALLEGDMVKKGQTIATVVNPEFIKLQESYLTTSSKLQLAQQEEKRQKELQAGDAGILKNLQSATTELNILQAQKAALKKQLQILGVNPQNLTPSSIQPILQVKSPINGTISHLFAKIGAKVEATTPLAEIVDNHSLHVDLQVFEKDLPKLKIGQTVHFTITNNPIKEYDAEIFSIGSSFENPSKTIQVHAKVKGNLQGLIDGMNITGIVSLDKALTPAVPNQAIVESEGKYYIFVVDAEKSTAQEITFRKTQIIKGISNVGYTAITFVGDFPKKAKIAVKNAFFINATLVNSGEHEH